LIALSQLQDIQQYFPSQINLLIYFIASILIVGSLFASQFLDFINKILPKKFNKAKDKIFKLSQSFHALKKEGVYPKVVILSILVTLINIAILYYYFNIFDIQVNFLQATFCLTFLQLSLILPIHGIGKFGTFESIAILGFFIIGVPKNSAIVLAFSMHIISLIFYSFLALIGYFIIRKNSLI